MVHLSSRRALAGTALAFVGSTLAGTVIGLPTALAEAGLNKGDGVAGRALATLDSASVAQSKVVAGSGTISVASAISGASPTQLIKPLPKVAASPALPAATAAGVVAGVPGSTSMTAAAMGIPGVMIDAYKKAADKTNQTMPTCQIDWTLLAAIGKVETDHAAGGRVDAQGNATSNLDGPAIAKLNGTRAVGPMQFLPSTWNASGKDGNGDGVKNVQNIYDATYAAGIYLCEGGGGSLKDSNRLHDAIFSYNHAEWYVQKVINLMNGYAGGVVATPAQTGAFTPTTSNGTTSNGTTNNGTTNNGTTNNGTTNNGTTNNGNGGSTPTRSTAPSSTPTSTPTATAVRDRNVDTVKRQTPTATSTTGK